MSVICEERGECIAGLVFVEAVSHLVILGDAVSLRFGLVSGMGLGSGKVVGHIRVEVTRSECTKNRT